MDQPNAAGADAARQDKEAIMLDTEQGTKEEPCLIDILHYDEEDDNPEPSRHQE